MPAVRVLWIGLVALAGYGTWFLGHGLGIANVVVLPLTAVLVDLAFQRFRFESLRFPDAAIATGLFLGLIFPPTVPLVAAGAAVLGAITVKHVLRYRGRPWFNPAAVGLTVGAVLFGIAPAWWAAISEPLLLVVGAVIFTWNLPRWRLSTTFLVAYAGFAILARYLFLFAGGGSGTLSPGVLFLAAVDPTVLFFGLFMVAEPRAAPASPHSAPIFGVLVAVAAAVFPAFAPTMALPFALLTGNVAAVLLRRPRAAPSVAGVEATGSARKRAARGAPRPARATARRWRVSSRIGAGVAGFALVLLIAAVTCFPATSSPVIPPTHGLGGGGAYGGTPQGVSHCQSDNQTIDPSTLAYLHKTLGPSVILSYSAASGFVVFYDPVNAVTVSETDLYEDFGFAEFNGDDYATPGCVPP